MRALCCLSLLALPAVSFAASPPPVTGRRGVVATDHELASAAGLATLRQGGNAVDAACAAAFALGVVNPAGSGIGGGGFMLVRPPGKEPVVIDFRETAPRAATATMYSKPGVSSSASVFGGLAVATPGEVAGCALAVRRYGKLGLRRVLAPAIRLARGGFAVGPHLARSLRRKRALLRRARLLRRAFLRRGKVVRVGQRLRRPRLARALSAIARGGPRVFYRGWIARDIADTVRRAGGVLDAADLAAYRVKLRKPLKTRFAGHAVYVMPPPSSGGVALIQSLNILRRRGLKKLGHNSSRYLHLLAETFKHAFADRARFIADPDFVKVPVARLTAQSYADRLNRRIGAKARKPNAYGWRRKPARAPTTDRGTSHLSVIDRRGMAVALTTSIDTSFGAALITTKSGIILNNTMDDFATHPGRPNAFGLVQGPQNAVAALKRPLSSMSPTLVVRRGKVALAIGGSGGPTIITGTLQALLNHLVFKLDVAAAVARSRIHHQWLPRRLWVEDDLPRDVITNLRRRGQRAWLQRHPFTAVQAVARDAGGLLSGAADPRKLGRAAAY